MASVLGNTAAAPPEAHRASGGHLPALDGLRGLAILLVMLTHAIGLPLAESRSTIDATGHAFARFGWTGVDLFFVLSGFLITGILLDTRNEPRRWVRFYARRSLRIFPLYYGVLVGLFVLLPLAAGHWSEPAYQTLEKNQGWFWLYAVNFLEIWSKGTGATLNTVHFWSLSIEEQFYLFWPLVVFAVKPRTILRIAGVVAVAGLAARIWFAAADPFGYPGTSYLFTPVRLDGLMMGAVLAVLARSNGGLERLRTIAPVVAMTGALAILSIGIWRGIFLYKDPVVNTIGFPIVAVTYGALLVMVLNARTGTWLNRFFAAGFLRSWGKYSYGIYVFHFLIMGAFGWFLPIWQYEIGGSRLPAAVLFAVILAAVSFGTAWVSYNVYEKRFLALKRFFEREPVPATADAPSMLPEVGSPRMVRSAPEV